MALHSLYPSFIQIQEHSAYGRHIRTLPTLQWNSLGGTNGFGGYEAWDSSDRDADDMVQEFCTAAKELFPTSYHFDSYIIYNYPSADAAPQPVKTNTIAIAGTVASPGINKATQQTWSYFDSGFNTFKVVLLDVDCGSNFEPLYPADLNADQTAFADVLASVNNAWASRAGLVPTVLRKVTSKLNDKLRAEYGTD